MTELQKRYAYKGPMSQTNHADLMQRIDAAREQINNAIGCNYTEVLLYAIGRINPIPDAEMPQPKNYEQSWSNE
jgi:hypothetical protein